MKSKKSTGFYFRCTENELELLKKKAQERGISLSQYLIRRGLDKPDNSFSKKEVLDLFIEINPHVGKIGSNLNQIARYNNYLLRSKIINTDKYEVTANILMQANEMLTKIERAYRAIMRSS